MVRIEIPEEEAKAFHHVLLKMNYDSISKCCRREPVLGSGRRLEDVAWAARSLILDQIKAATNQS